MKELKHVRVDHRLIHGQILIKWLETKNINRVIIIDDRMKENPIMEDIMRRSLPKMCSMQVWDCKEAKEYIDMDQDLESALILVRRIDTLTCLEQRVKFTEINIACMPFSEGKEKIYEHLYADRKEQKQLKQFVEEEIKVYIQMVPDSEKIWMKEILEQ